MKTKKLNTTKLWKVCREMSLFGISVALVAVMTICLLVNSGIAQKVAEHSEGIYIVSAIWFAIVAFCSCKYLRRGKNDAGVTTIVSTGGKHYAKKGV